jgi:BNR/asp-box repeat domain protein
MKRIFLAATMLLSFASIAQVQNRQEMIRSQNLQKSWVKNIPFQALEISRGAGEIIQVERNPNNPYELYVALAESGVWYSENNGASFSPTFADFMTPQADAMAVDWDNHTLWVANHQGVFFKEQGKDWQATSPVGNILVRQITLFSPTNLCLSAMGEGDSIQGVLCTTDKGKNWNQTFGQVGVNELKKAPSAPETLFLAAWDCAFSPSNITAAGKQSGIYKSNNAGATWELITGAGSGFPQGNIGKISLAVFSPTSLYALVDNRERAKEDPSNLNLQSLSAKDFLALDDEKISQYIYNHSLEKKYSVDNLREAVRSGAVKVSDLTRFTDALPAVIGAEIYYSADGGKSWVKKNNKPLTNVFYNKGYEVGALAVNPKQENELYLSGVPLLRSNNGGITWTLLKDNPKEQNVHQLFADERQLILVTDQGMFQSLDQGRTWAKQQMPQTASVISLSIGKPENDTFYTSILNEGVFKHTTSGWSFLSSEKGALVVTPENKFFLSQPLGSILPLRQNKVTLPYDKKTKQRYPLQTALALSPQNNTILYAGTNTLFQSLNEGKQWNTISPDLTNGDKGGILSYGTISAICESPFQFGLLYTGSDDGMIYTSQNGGVSWQMIYSSFPTPNRVACLLASKHTQERVYAILQNDNHQALLFRSNNMGKSWDNLKANLPEETLNVIVEDPANEQVLYLGTENGLYVSFDMGEKWHPFKENLPRSSVSAIAINPQNNQLYVGTKGHGFFTANVTSLRELRAAVQAQLFYPLKETYTIAYSPKWGNAPSPWQAAEEPVLYLESFASKDNNTIKISVVKNKITLAKFTYQTKVGFNFIPFDLTFVEDGRIAYEKKLLTTFKKADNGKYYLPKGNYQIIFESDGFEEERTLVIE